MLERIGTIAGILGAFLVAGGLGAVGYPCFLVSSALLLGSAIHNGQGNFIWLQMVYLLANILGLWNSYV